MWLVLENLGGKTSYAKIQDDYNKFITEKGYNIFCGIIGNNKTNNCAVIVGLIIWKKGYKKVITNVFLSPKLKYERSKQWHTILLILWIKI